MIVHDDASTDHTAEIVKEYEKNTQILSEGFINRQISFTTVISQLNIYILKLKENILQY